MTMTIRTKNGAKLTANQMEEYPGREVAVISGKVRYSTDWNFIRRPWSKDRFIVADTRVSMSKLWQADMPRKYDRLIEMWGLATSSINTLDTGLALCHWCAISESDRSEDLSEYHFTCSFCLAVYHLRCHGKLNEQLASGHDEYADHVVNHHKFNINKLRPLAMFVEPWHTAVVEGEACCCLCQYAFSDSAEFSALA